MLNLAICSSAGPGEEGGDAVSPIMLALEFGVDRDSRAEVLGVDDEFGDGSGGKRDIEVWNMQ